jgi:predicted RNA-binding protein with PIN domain
VSQDCRPGPGEEPLPEVEVYAVPPLPPEVRGRVVGLAAEALGALPPEEVPPALRAFARFTPARRARLATVPLAHALENDPLLRQRIAARVADALPDAARALETGHPGAAVSPTDLAALLYLLRPPGWAQDLAEACDRVTREVAAEESRGQAEELTALRDALRSTRAEAQEEAGRLRSELAAARAQAEQARRRLREELGTARRAVAAAGEEAVVARRERDEAVGAAAAAEADARRARGRATDAEAALEAVRRARREGRAEDDVRLRMLLDALMGAAQGIRRELALAPAESRPADAVAAALEAEVATELPGAGDARAQAADDPAVLGRLLALPAVHLLVDGYNVTMSAYGGAPLEVQRGRLLAGLGSLAARTGAEVTCVFDGAGRVTPLALAAPRGVRLLFSPAAVTADEVIRQLVRQEPPGRPVVVVSGDKEVAEGVRRAGARPVPAAALVRLLERS